MLENLSVVVRPRTRWESVEMGFSMVRTWAKSIYTIWFVVTLPFFLVLIFTLQSSLALVVFWWFKPLFDRLCLFVLSQSTFGKVPNLDESLKFLKSIFKTDLIASVTWLRLLDIARSFTLPVRQLEGLKGAKKRQRLSLLKRREFATTATWLGVSCIHLEFVLMVVPLVFYYVNFEGEIISQQYDFWDQVYDFWFMFFEDGGPKLWLTFLFYYVAVSVIEPIYVASGFSLYLNRRTHLESWDVEIASTLSPSAHKDLAIWGTFSGSLSIRISMPKSVSGFLSFSVDGPVSLFIMTLAIK